MSGNSVPRKPVTLVLLAADATDDEIDAFCRALGWKPEGEAEDVKAKSIRQIEEAFASSDEGVHQHVPLPPG